VSAPFDVFIGPDEETMAWPAWQHLVGNAYLILGVGLLVLFGLRGPRADVGAPSSPPAAGARRPATR
ncbi:MAG TPA: hypothetical protein VD813_09330, partial [Pseudonocardia sp.]|nr:hypothetical protein [Pseudonocardia sp.]